MLAFVSRLIPLRVGNQLRASSCACGGFGWGRHPASATPRPSPAAIRADFPTCRLGSHCLIDVGCAFELGDNVTIGDRVTLGYQVIIITTTHELGPREHRAGPLVRNPVHVEDGALIGARCVILPGVTVGVGAIVDPGSVVNMNVPPNARVRGIPARQVEELAP